MYTLLNRPYSLAPGGRSVLFIALILLSLNNCLAQAEINPEVAPEGMVRLKDTKVDYAYIKPDADLRAYKKFILAAAPVSFHQDWKKNQRRYHNTNVSDRDIKRTEKSTAKVFHESFAKELERKNGYPIVSNAAPDVLLLRPTVYDLDLVALDTLNSRSEVYSQSTGSASLMLELSDSVTGEVLAIIYDTKKDRRNDFMERSTRVSNTRDTRRMFSSWASLLRKSFEDMHKEGRSWEI